MQISTSKHLRSFTKPDSSFVRIGIHTKCLIQTFRVLAFNTWRQWSMVIVLVSRYHPTKKLPQSRPWASPATLTTSSYLVGWFQVILVGYVSYWRRAHYCCHTSTNLCRVGYQWKWRNTDAKNHYTILYVLNTYDCIWRYIQRVHSMLSCLNVSAKCQSYIALLDVHSMPLLQATSCSRRVLSMQTLCTANSRKSGSEGMVLPRGGAI